MTKAEEEKLKKLEKIKRLDKELAVKIKNATKELRKAINYSLDVNIIRDRMKEVETAADELIELTGGDKDGG
jgi:hypothetical protein